MFLETSNWHFSWRERCHHSTRSSLIFKRKPIATSKSILLSIRSFPNVFGHERKCWQHHRFPLYISSFTKDRSEDFLRCSDSIDHFPPLILYSPVVLHLGLDLRVASRSILSFLSSSKASPSFFFSNLYSTLVERCEERIPSHLCLTDQSNIEMELSRLCRRMKRTTSRRKRSISRGWVWGWSGTFHQTTMKKKSVTNHFSSLGWPREFVVNECHSSTHKTDLHPHIHEHCLYNEKTEEQLQPNNKSIFFIVGRMKRSRRMFEIRIDDQPLKRFFLPQVRCSTKCSKTDQMW